MSKARPKRRDKHPLRTAVVDEFNLLDQHVLRIEHSQHFKQQTSSSNKSSSSSSSPHGTIQYTSYEHVRQHVDFFFQIKDQALNRAFYDFSSMKKSGGFLMLISLMITLVMLPMHILIFYEDLKETDNKNYSLRCVTSFGSLLGTFLCSVTGWILYIHHASDNLLPYLPGRWLQYLSPHLNPPTETTAVSPSGRTASSVNHSHTDRQGHNSSVHTNHTNNSADDNNPTRTASNTSTTSRFDDKSWNPIRWTLAKRRQAIYYINLVFVGSAQLFFITIFFRRSLGLNCSATSNYAVRMYSGTKCFYGDDLIHVLLYNAVMLLTIPILFFINLPDTPIGFVWFLFILSICLFVLLAVGMGHSDIIPSMFFWTCLCYFTIVDIQSRNVLMFLANRELSETIAENERMAEQIHANEMRSMIANVAHDLKTPLSSFITGIDYIQHVMADFKTASDRLGSNIVPALRAHITELISNIEVCATNIRNTNAFMLMTINRCIDYTKASKGLKLVPRHETIDLRDALELPLQCMQNIQQRIEIQLNPLPPEICSHIITDKQWLQENILCLLSNAVKYSTEGTVTISLFLEKDTLSQAKVRRQVLKIEPVGDVKQVSEWLEHKSGVSARIVPTNTSEMTLATSLEDGSVVTELGSKLPSTIISLKESFSENEMLLRIEIEDTGIGMAEEAMATLFNPFKQTQRLAGGTGLGLYSLAKRVEALNGDYGVMKRRDGIEGSLFWFSIPYRPDPMIAQLQDGSLNLNLPRARQFFNSVMRKQDSDRVLTPKEGKSGKTNIIDPLQTNNHTEPSLKSKLDILIVDDSVAIVKMTTLMLKKLGHTISTAENGEVAVKMIHEKWNTTQKRFDVVLMDLQMPVMDGLEATRRIRRLEDLQKPSEQRPSLGKREPSELKVNDIEDDNNDTISRETMMSWRPVRRRQVIVGMSANSDHETAAGAISAGVDTFIAKPFNLNTFTETIDALLCCDGEDR